MLIAPVVQAKPRLPLPPFPEGQLTSRRFDSQENPLLAVNVRTIESWSGYALNMVGEDPSLLALPEVTATGETNLTRTAATLRFWFAPNWTSARLLGFGPGEEARLLEVGAWSSRGAVAWWSLVTDPEGTSILLLAQRGGEVVEILQAPIDWTTGEWHQIAMAWSAKESAIYLDGQRAAAGPGVMLEPLSDFQGTNGFCIGSDVSGKKLAQGQFEELYSFGRMCSGEELARDYQRTRARAALGPLTEKEEQDTLSAAAQAASERASGGSEPAQSLLPEAKYGCSLWLRITPEPNNNVLLTLHNTTPGKTYQIWTTPDIVSPEWTHEQTVTGASAHDYTQTPVSMNGRPRLFFRATELGPYTVDRSIRGLDRWEASSHKPDSMGAIGPTHFVELINGAVAVFDKDTGERLEQRTFSEFFAGGDLFDPRILYDHHSQRWVACAIDQISEEVKLAVSQGPSPLGLLTDWTVYVIPVALPYSESDYVTLGTDLNGLYLSVFHYHWATENGQSVFHDDGDTVVAIKKPEIYQGNLLHTSLFVSPAEFSGSFIQPAVNFDSPLLGGHSWFVAKGPPQQGPPYRPGQIHYRRLHWNGNTAEWVDAAWQLLTEPQPTYLDYFDLSAGGVSAPQAGGEVRIDMTPGGLLMTALIRNGFLWICQQVGLDGTDGDYDGGATPVSVDRTGAQWLKLQIHSTGEPLTHIAHGRIFDDCSTNPYYYYYPSLMVNAAGDMLVGFSASRDMEYIGAFYSWRFANGATLVRPALVRTGRDYWPNNEWGDYSSTSLDPSDGMTFWTVQQYAKEPRDASTPLWGTWIARIRPIP